MHLSIIKPLTVLLCLLNLAPLVYANTHIDAKSVETERRERACENVTSSGEKTLCYIKYDYNNTQIRCNQNDSEPGVLCTGVVFRGTDSDLSRSYYSWNPSPASVTSGGVSFSYLRKDSKFNRLAYLYSSGFIFYPVNFTPKNKDNTIKILCGFSLDAGTNARSDRGCGQYGNVSVSRPCTDQGIDNASDWFDINYQNANKNRERICGFPLYSDDNSINTAKMFEAMIKSQILLKDISFNEQNELRIETWAQNKSDIPIESFFYLSGMNKGLKSSQKDQSDFYDQFGEIIPIIEISFPSSMKDDVIFSYNEKDQVVK